MSDCFNHACDAFDSLGQDHMDTPIKNYWKGKCDYNTFISDPLYYHRKHKVELVHETKLVYRFKNSKGLFWVAKSLCKKFKPEKDTVFIWHKAVLNYSQE